MNLKFTIKDKIVEDSLVAVSLYNQDQQSYTVVVTGGIANQIYISNYFPELLRPTHDVDLIIYPKIDASFFRNNTGPFFAKELNRYNPEVNILRHVYEIKTENEDGDIFLVHSYKYTRNGWERQKRNIERQVSNANEIINPKTNKPLKIIRPEDLLFTKLSRIEKIKNSLDFSDGLEKHYKDFIERDWNRLAEIEIYIWLETLKKQKTRLPAFYDRGEDEFKKELRRYTASKDMFDVSVISRLISEEKIEFDERYYDEILQENNVLSIEY
ncbi:MAG: hypothetical protein DRP13_02645 [Candidatus Aenigmatarchaeota archaeon]|nr:MAG: hypothetical protein DRP13_02645 [Candidatus Aenigmarchaeota archaeon]